MKKTICGIGNVFLFLLIVNPIMVNARIVCNDGTVSKSCNDCHQGCCSKHGGCSNSSSSSSSGSQSTTSGSSSSSKKPSTTTKPKSSDTSIKKIEVDNTEIVVSDNMSYSTTNEKVEIIVVLNDEKASATYSKNPILTIGENIIDIKVTAENGNTKRYKLNITREKILSDNKKPQTSVVQEDINVETKEDDKKEEANDSIAGVVVCMLAGGSYIAYRSMKKKKS